MEDAIDEEGPSPVPIDADSAASFLSSAGPLARGAAFYEERPSQMRLARKIAEAFNGDRVAVLEAGTGVGKSFAYLVPAILWASENKERVVVSTGTINLQQQLFEKDIPAALRITGKRLKAVLMKGRQNYLCLRRMGDAEAERDLFADDGDALAEICRWAETSSTGSRSELPFMPPESVWSKVNSESDACMGRRCQFQEKCFVMKSRKEAADAGIIVVNHHLLFADIESRMGGAGYEDAAVLPPYRRVIFDEAHGIEESATSFFSESFTRLKVMKQVSLLYRAWKGNVTGLLAQASALSSAENFASRADSAVSSLKDSLSALDESALIAMGDEGALRIHPGNSGRLSHLFLSISNFKSSLALFNDFCAEVLEGVEERDSDFPAVWESKAVLHRLEAVASLCDCFLRWDESAGSVFWLQKARLPPRLPGEAPLVFAQFTQTPLDIAPKMRAGVFEPMGTVVCTSATLRTGGDFSYWLRRTGASLVDSERLSVDSFESPFPYRTNVLFAVPSDAPFPDSGFFQGYIESAVPRLILASGGRALVLFTSYDSLRCSFAAARAALSGSGIELYRQGDDDRFRLLEKFKRDATSVLFATDSFWEGVDVPGDSLSQVIIVKLPFPVPSDPVFAARCEDMERRGGVPFMQLSVPQAVIKFRQGFGRLMRRGDDRGAVVVLDRRIVEKRYGRMFTSSVPMTRRMYNPLEDVLGAVENFV